MRWNIYKYRGRWCANRTKGPFMDYAEFPSWWEAMDYAHRGGARR